MVLNDMPGPLKVTTGHSTLDKSTLYYCSISDIEGGVLYHPEEGLSSRPKHRMIEATEDCKLVVTCK